MSERIDKSPLYSSTEIFTPTDDVFQDERPLEAEEIDIADEGDINRLWEANSEIRAILKESETLEQARENLYEYLHLAELEVFFADSDWHPLEKANVRECIRTFRSVIGPINEKRTQFSALDVLWRLAGQGRDVVEADLSRAFILECLHLFRGVRGESGLYGIERKPQKGIPDFLRKKGREAARERSDHLDEVARTVDQFMSRYPNGLDPDIIRRREKNKQRILRYLQADESDWQDYHWHLRNVIRDEATLAELIQTTDEERRAIRIARENRIPFGITPYYLSLIDEQPSREYDHAIRAQVIPPLHYVNTMKQHRNERSERMDFMGEHDTSPIDLVTRRYPKIAILKPYDTCAQICVYCQRNWEIEEVLSPHAMATRGQLDSAIRWFRDHQRISDCLITGGDPGVMSDKLIDRLLKELSQIDHLTRIRWGTRTPVVLPFRFTKEHLNILARYHEFGRREICVVTHIEHPYEVTPDMVEVIGKIKRLGIGVYNQEVFTLENSRRFETAALRELLRKVGVDPYYTFNAKGKSETKQYRVPIARILQERKEEARLLPGMSRTDEPVFNVPRLGKNHLRAWEDHRVVMIMPDGRRVYEFHPWEKNLTLTPPYNHYDVPIYDYLREMEKRGENPDDYKSIWFYY